MWTHGKRRSPTRERVTGARTPPVRPCRRRNRGCTTFQRPAATRPLSNAGIEGGDQMTMSSARLCLTKCVFRVKFRDQFTLTGLACPRGQEADHSRSERGKLEGTRYGIEAATYCGGPDLDEVVAATFLAENWNRRTVGKAWCVRGAHGERRWLRGRVGVGIVVGGCVFRCELTKSAPQAGFLGLAGIELGRFLLDIVRAVLQRLEG